MSACPGSALEMGARWLPALPQLLPPRGPRKHKSRLGRAAPRSPCKAWGVAGGRVCSTQGNHSARAAGKATAAIDQSRAGEIRHRGAPLEPLKTSALLGRVVQGLGKCHWRGSGLLFMRATETLSCPGTGLGPQRAAQEAPAHSRAGQSFQLRVWTLKRGARRGGEFGRRKGGNNCPTVNSCLGRKDVFSCPLMGISALPPAC